MSNEGKASALSIPDPRLDLAFPKLTEDMVERLQTYGKEATFPANFSLFNNGQRGGGPICLSSLTANRHVTSRCQWGNQNHCAPSKIRLLWGVKSSELARVARSTRTVLRMPPSSHTAQRAASPYARRERYRKSHYAGDNLASHWAGAEVVLNGLAGALRLFEVE
jgi:hypothetical protein